MKKNEIDDNLIFKKHTISKIFEKDEKNAHLYSFKASKFYVPKNKYRIFINFNSDNSNICSQENNKIITINVKCYPKRNIAYSKDIEDDATLEKLFNYLKENDYTIKLKNIDDEQCLAVICNRTHLENSMSNQIAYFLSIDEKLLKSFMKLINKKLKEANKEVIKENEFKEFKYLENIKK